MAGDVGPVDIKCSAVELLEGTCVTRGLLLRWVHGSVLGTPRVVVVVMVAEAVGPRELRTDVGVEDALKGGRLLGASGDGGGATVVPSEGPQRRSQHSRRTWKLWQYGTGPGWSRLRHTSPKLTLHCTTCPTTSRLTFGAFSERHSMS